MSQNMRLLNMAQTPWRQPGATGKEGSYTPIDDAFGDFRLNPIKIMQRLALARRERICKRFATERTFSVALLNSFVNRACSHKGE